jgi:hypothetical protein
LQAKGLRDPDGLLKGSGNVVRHIVLQTPQMLDDPRVEELMEEAVERARVPFSPEGAHRLTIKSVSKNQRPRRPAARSAMKAGTAKKSKQAAK